MSQTLDPLRFPLKGSRLIEASAGTGKTWTIAALYVRLVLGHGDADADAAAYARPLAPSEILVMTFTRAATRELSDRVRARLVEAAHCFRGEPPPQHDAFLAGLIGAYPDEPARLKAAHRLMLAAEAMDECAIFTIDAWCQRMLREHAFDSGSLFDEELVSSEEGLFRDAVRDYWRQHVYPLDGEALAGVLDCWKNLEALEASMRQLVRHAGLFAEGGEEALAQMIARVAREQRRLAAELKTGWIERVERMAAWVEKNRAGLHASRMKQSTLDACFAALRAWCGDPGMIAPGDDFDGAWHRLTPAHIADCFKAKFSADIPEDFDAVALLQQQLAALEPLAYQIQRHAACRIAQRMQELKRRRRQFGFEDMLTRLRTALEGGNGEALTRRIVSQYPVALIDEFQDTSPEQYRIFNHLYRIADNADELGLFLIGDPKQAIYGFRGADIHSYLAARRATEGRHYLLGTNFRSSDALVQAVNRVFQFAEGEPDMPGKTGKTGHAAGAFRFRRNGENPLPFEPVAANGRKECLMASGGPVAALTFWCSDNSAMNADSYREHFAAHCAEQIVTLLNDDKAGFARDGALIALKPADIAVLVRDRYEAAAVRRALQRRKVPSVYLSDKDSVFDSAAAADVLQWLHAVANPLDASLARAAFATRTAALSLDALARLAADDMAWEARIEQLKTLRGIWQRQGVLAMLRRFIHELGLPAKLLRETGGERGLTDLLHLAELLQGASQNLDGEHALIRWLAEQVNGDGDGDGGDERILRLESDAELVQVITVHKSKGLEYPLVFLPFAVSARAVDKRNRSFFAYADESGARHIDFSLSDAARDALDAARMEEDLRLLYVALTRARHALWLGVASLKDKIHDCAFGYLLGGGAKIDGAALMARLQEMRGDCGGIAIVDATAEAGHALLSRRHGLPALRDIPAYAAAFERNWKIASYSSITRELGSLPAPATSLADKLAEDDDRLSFGKLQDSPWHRFPRGSLPGQFLHAQLEWMANEGFAIVDDPAFETRLRARCERAGWGHRQDDAVAWLRAIAATPLPPLGAALCQLEKAIPETEFWFPADEFATGALDALCQQHLLDGTARAPLSPRQLHGMLRGFKDLVFEHEGRYWVLDYKSNALAPNDDGYHKDTLAAGMAACRYDVQGAIYLLALHRLLKSRLGTAYDPEAQLGGAVFYFLRGLNNPDTRGCYRLPAHAALLEALDALLPAPAIMEDGA